MTGEHSKHSFVARIWLESGDSGDTTWRGHLRHVQGEQEGYFQDLMEMREFLGRVSGVTGPALTAQPLKDATKFEFSAKSESSTKSEPSEKPESGTVTNLKRKDSPEAQMHPTQAATTKTQADPNSRQSEVNWGARGFYGVLVSVLVFFWWLLIYSGGVVGHHT